MRFVRFRAYPKKCGTGLQPVYFTQIEAHQVVAAGARRTAGTTAIVVVARRMLEDAFTLLKRDEAFRYVAVSVADASQQVGTVTPAPESRSGRKAASSVAG